ncbi:MAG: glutamate racemase [Candidatus Atribacteria bacterium]|nr:glutamate racemase [Candidatus Atribacteria bacterium]
MKIKRPLGIIDSGIGGLSVVRAVRTLLPAEDIIYVADPLNFPYGEKTKEELLEIVKPIIGYLSQRKVKLVVTACGTLSSLCLSDLAQLVTVPVMGIVQPACQEAGKATKRGKIGVLATRATVKSGAFHKTLREINPALEVVEEAWPDFVRAVEKGEFNSPEWRKQIKSRLISLKEKGIDTLIMGCTHFSLISWFFQELVGRDIEIVDPGWTCAQEVKKKLSLKQENSFGGKLSILVRGDISSFQKSLQSFPFHFQEEIRLFPVDLGANISV